MASPSPRSSSARLEPVLNPLSILVVLPLFALANTGVALGGHLLAAHGPREVALGIVVARLVGKMVGITVAAALVVRLGVAGLPEGVRWSQLLGAAAMCGMGFTVPLLFASAAFAGHGSLIAASQIGLLVGTAVAFAVGALILVLSSRRAAARSPD